jgi:hypothetical protein
MRAVRSISIPLGQRLTIDRQSKQCRTWYPSADPSSIYPILSFSLSVGTGSFCPHSGIVLPSNVRAELTAVVAPVTVGQVCAQFGFGVMDQLAADVQSDAVKSSGEGEWTNVIGGDRGARIGAAGERAGVEHEWGRDGGVGVADEVAVDVEL